MTHARSLVRAIVCVLVLPCAARAQSGTVPSATTAQPAATIELTLVRNDDGAVVPAADVTWFRGDQRELDGRRIADERLDVLDEFLARRGVHTQSDAHGRVRVPHGGESVFVAARADGRLALGDFGPRTSAASLTLFPDWDAAVHVIDAEGRALADASVVLLRRSSRFRRDVGVLRTRTDAAGDAVLAHAGYAFERATAERSNVPVEWLVALDGCFAQPVETPLRRPEKPNERLQLVSPPVGSVEVHITDTDGTPWTGDVEVELGAASSIAGADALIATLRRTPDWLRFWERERAPGLVVAQSSAGVVVFERVGAGAVLVASAQRNADSSRSYVSAAGPAKTGERAVLELGFGAKHPSFRAQLVDERGNPLRDREVALSLYALPPADGWEHSWDEFDTHEPRGPFNAAERRAARVRTDREGRVSLDVAPELVLAGTPSLGIEVYDGERTALTANVDLGERWSAGVHDLGQVKLGAARLLAGGRVIDEEGAPIPGVTVALTAIKGLPTFSVVTGADGRFELRGAEPRRAVELSAYAEGYVSIDFQEAHAGASDVDLLMRTAGTIRGRVLAPPGRTAEQFGVRVTLAGTESWSTPAWMTSIESDGSFALKHMSAGRYLVQVMSNERAIFARDSIELTRGGDVDLGTIDLTPQVKPVTLHITSESGEPLSGIYFLPEAERQENPVFPHMGTDLWTQVMPQTFERGELRLLLKELPFDIELASAGFRIERLRLDQKRDIHMRPGLRVRIRSTKPLGAVPEGAEFLITLVSDQKELPSPLHGTTPFESTPFDARGEALLVAPGPGAYWFEWSLRRKSPGGFSARTQLDERQQIVVVESDVEQTISLAPVTLPADLDAR